MKNLGGLVKFTKSNDSIIAGLMIAYLLFDVNMPSVVNDLVNSNMGAGILIISAMALFVKVNNPVLTVLAFVSVYELMRRAKQSYRSRSYASIPSSNNPKTSFKSLSNFGYTLEEGFAGGVKENNDNEDKEDDGSNPVAFSVEGLGGGSYAKF